MPTYEFAAKNTQEQQIQGTLSAINARFAYASLENQGYHAIRVHRHFSLTFKRRIKTCDITAFFQQLSTFISAGIPLLESLELIQQNSTLPLWRTILEDIKHKISAGESFTLALSHYPKVFSSFARHLVELGESTGTLDIMLLRITLHLEKSETLKKRILKALIYPATIVSVALLIMTILLIFVVPQFQAIFARQNAPLPFATQCVINISKGIRSYGWLIVIGFISLTHSLLTLKRKNLRIKKIFDYLQLKIPLFHTLFHHAILAKISRTLCIAVQSGLPLLQALDISKKMSVNTFFIDALTLAAQHISEGNSLHESLSSPILFPNHLRALIKTGEKTGKLDVMLEKCACFYEDSVDTRVSHLSELIEPLIMIILGIMIGCVVIAMYLPIFRLGSLF